jgi:hypothetical protein
MIDRAIIVKQPAPPPNGRTWTLRLDTGPRYPAPLALSLRSRGRIGSCSATVGRTPWRKSGPTKRSLLGAKIHRFEAEFAPAPCCIVPDPEGSWTRSSH